MSSAVIAPWALAFAFTQLVEMGIYAHAHGRRRPLAERLAIAFACSGITHPLVWFVVPSLCERWLGMRGWWSTVAVAEAFAVLAEALFLAAFAVRTPLRWALLANGVSFTLGLFGYLYLGF